MAKRDNTNDTAEPGMREAPDKASEFSVFLTFFTSMKTAIALLLILAGLSVGGTLLNDPSDQTALYHSPPYLGLLALLGINLLACSIHRFKPAWRRTFHPRVALPAEQLARLPAFSEKQVHGDAAELTTRLTEALQAEGFAVRRAQEDDTQAIHATKGRLHIWGPYLTHISLLLIFGGALFGNMLGFSGFLTLNEGGRTADAYRVPGSTTRRPLGFRVGLRSFAVHADAQHNPTGYQSDIQVFQGDTPVLSKVIDVNHPLSYHGVSFFQSSFGLVGLWMTVTAPDGKTFRVPIDVKTNTNDKDLSYSIPPKDALQVIESSGKRLAFLVHYLQPDFAGLDEKGEAINTSPFPLHPAVMVLVNAQFPEDKRAWTPLGWLERGKPVTTHGFTLTLERVVHYTGLSVSQNPGLPVIYAGFALLLFGIIASFYVSHRTIYARVTPGPRACAIAIGEQRHGVDADEDQLVARVWMRVTKKPAPAQAP